MLTARRVRWYHNAPPQVSPFHTDDSQNVHFYEEKVPTIWNVETDLQVALGCGTGWLCNGKEYHAARGFRSGEGLTKSEQLNHGCRHFFTDPGGPSMARENESVSPHRPDPTRKSAWRVSLFSFSRAEAARPLYQAQGPDRSCAPSDPMSVTRSCPPMRLEVS